jgi:hypothetical protein
MPNCFADLLAHGVFPGPVTFSSLATFNGKIVQTLTMNAAAGVENAFEQNITINKAAGNSFARRTVVNYTLAPGVNYLDWMGEGATARYYVMRNGSMGLVPLLNAAAGDEYGLNIEYTTNKAAGDDYGLRINQTDTLSPGTSYLAWFGVGGTAKAWIKNDGRAYFAGAYAYGASVPTDYALSTTGKFAVINNKAGLIYPYFFCFILHALLSVPGSGN